MYATRPINTARSAIVDFRPRTSAFPPPGIDAGAEYQCRDREQRHPHQRGGLTLGDRQAAVTWRLRADRNQVLLLRKPVDRVHEQVLVALNADRVVGRKVRVADRDETRFGWSLVRLRRILWDVSRVCRRHRADCDRTRLVALVG